MNIIQEQQLGFDDVCIMPKRSTLNSRSEVDIFRTFKWEDAYGAHHELKCIPVMVANMGTVGTPKMTEYLTPKGYMVALEKHYSKEVIAELYTKLYDKAVKEDHLPYDTYTDRIALSIGIKESLEDFKWLNRNFKINIINCDVPNGYCPKVIERLEEIRKIFPEAFIIVGTVVTSDITQDLLMRGANCIRLGICNGSSCLTAQKTGVTRPIISMLTDCADAAHNLKKYIMLDGGIRYPADLCKALIAGADFVMSGSIFAGTDMAEGELIEKWYRSNEVEPIDAIEGENPTSFKPVYKKKLFRKYYGMSSFYAQNKHFGGTQEYRTSEGREKLIPYTGKLEDVLKDYEGGLRSMMTYIGARTLKDIPRHGSFYKCNFKLNDKFEKCEDF